MKKLFLLTVAVLSGVTLTFAQGELRMGAKAGLNLASIGGDYDGLGGLDTRVSFHIGALVEIPVTEKISVQPEILYSSQGSKGNYGFLFDEVNDFKVKLDYLNFPILGKYHIIEGLSGELGPVIGILVKAESDDGDGDAVDIKDLYKSVDIGVGIGATYRLPMGVFGSLRYNKGVTDINDDPEFTYKNQNNVFQVSVGYTF